MNLFMALASLVLLVGSGEAYAQAESKRLLTPRGAEMEVTVHSNSESARPTLLVAPGQSCNSKGSLFESIGRMGEASGWTVVRFEWAYCVKDPSRPIPSDDLSQELEDFETALRFAKTLPSVDQTKIVFVGKSLGSWVAYSAFQAHPEAKALSLLTPICSAPKDEAHPEVGLRSVCEESYPKMKSDPRPILMAMGDRDPNCRLDFLYDYLKDSQGNILVSVAGGEHGFRLFKADGSLDEARTERNIATVVSVLLNWLEQAQ